MDVYAMMMTYFEMNGLGSANNDKNTTFTKYFLEN